LSEIIVAADLFVAYSTTLQWASLLSIPAIALEHYNLGYTLFDDMERVEVLTDLDTLPDMARSLLFDEKENSASAIGLDGKSCQRIVDACKAVIPA
jgi:hypothetical protein